MADSSGVPNPLSVGSGVGGSIGGGIGDLIGYFLSQGDRDTARKLMEQANAKMQGLNPNMTAQEAGSSAFNSLSMDPQTRAAQLDALGQLKNVYSNGGMDAQAKADTFAATSAADRNAQALNANIQNQMAQRGLSSSGANFAAQRSNAQNAANMASMQGMQAAAAGQQRAMGALNSYGALAGGIRGQDYQQASDRAGANDAISRFNAGQRQDAQQSTFNNGYQQAGGIAGMSGMYTNQANDTVKKAHDAGQFGGSAIGTAVAASDERLKVNVMRHGHEVIPGVPLATFEYKHEPGVKYAGVIAQDLEKVAPEHVSKDSDGIRFVSAQFAPVRIGEGK